MKKFFILPASAIMALGIASCSQDNPGFDNPNDGAAHFTVNLGIDAGTRAAFADGLQANKLDYAVYDLDGNLVLQGEEDFGGALQTSVSIPLVNGLGYKIAFFAHEGNGSYTFNAEDATFTANYSAMTGDYNTTDHDSFFELVEIPEVKGALSQSVTLIRPVARLNWGTNDLDKTSVTNPNAYGENAANLTSKVVVKGVHTTYNMLEKKVTDATEDVEFAAVARPVSTDALSLPDFPVQGYEYVSMQYILVPSVSAVVDAEWIPYCSGKEMPSVTVPNCPVQANFQTNVYGALLTSPADFTVTKNEIFATPDYNVAWNGEVDTDIPADTDTKTLTISTPEQLAGLAQRVNDGESFRYWTVELANDIDLNNIVWTPIGVVGASQFAGVFDGKNYTVSNLNAVAQEPIKKGNESAGLFAAAALQVGTSERSVIKNLNIENATVRSGHYAGVIVGWTNSGVDITNCNVSNATVVSTYKNDDDSGDKAGGIAGYFYGGVIDNCSVTNSSITAARDLGGLVGMLQININNTNSSVTVKNSSVTDTEVIATSYTENIGEIAGRRAAARVIETNNTSSNVTLRVPIVDGLMRVNDTYELSKPAGLVKISEMVAEKPKTFEGKTIKMTANIDMSGIDFTPIANNITSYPSNAFTGIFDGNGYAISNLKASSTVKNYAAAGLFGAVVGGKTVIKNVTLKNPTITSSHFAGGIAGYISNNTGTVIENCKVIGGSISSTPENLGSEWDNGDKVGGILGFNDNGDFVRNCTVEGVALKGYRHVGSIGGYSNNLNCFTGNTAKNVTITQDDSHDYKNFNGKPSSTIFGPIVGSFATIGDNTALNVTFPTFE